MMNKPYATIFNESPSIAISDVVNDEQDLFRLTEDTIEICDDLGIILDTYNMGCQVTYDSDAETCYIQFESIVERDKFYDQMQKVLM